MKIHIKLLRAMYDEQAKGRDVIELLPNVPAYQLPLPNKKVKTQNVTITKKLHLHNDYGPIWHGQFEKLLVPYWCGQPGLQDPNLLNSSKSYIFKRTHMKKLVKIILIKTECQQSTLAERSYNAVHK